MDGDCDMGYRCSSGEALGDVLIPTFGLLQAGTEWMEIMTWGIDVAVGSLWATS